MKRGTVASTLAAALGTFVACGANGNFPLDHAATLGGASLTPLRKPDGGVRPIAVGETLRRGVGKALLKVSALSRSLGKLAPLQVGVGIPNACESVGVGLQDVVDSLPVD